MMRLEYQVKGGTMKSSSRHVSQYCRSIIDMIDIMAWSSTCRAPTTTSAV